MPQFFKTVSIFLISSILFQEFAFANPDLLKITLEPQASVENDKAWARKVLPVISESIATVEDAYKSPASDKILILIQDAHTNHSGQLNTAKALDLIGSFSGKYVFLEAGSGDVSLSFMRKYAPLEKRKQIAESFVRSGRLQGSEYLDLTSEHDFLLWGVENQELYARSVTSYAEVIQSREKFQNYLNRIDATVKVLKARLYNPLLLSFDQKHEKYLSEEISLTDYFQTLDLQARRIGISLEAYPTLMSLNRLKDLEAKIDFVRANEEQKTAVLSLTEADQKALMEASKESSASKLSSGAHDVQRAYFMTLEEKLGGQLPTYPELSKYLSYLKVSKKTDAKKIFEEKELLENEIYGRLAENADEKELITASKNVDFLQKLIKLTITPDEYKEYRSEKESYDITRLTGFLNKKIMDLGSDYDNAVFLEDGYEDIVSRCEAFYELTYQRDEAFVKNATEKMAETGEEKAVLITGGYHTPNLKHILKRQGVSYISLTPQILNETNQKRYEELLLAQEAVIIQSQPALISTPIVAANTLGLWPYVTQFVKGVSGNEALPKSFGPDAISNSILFELKTNVARDDSSVFEPNTEPIRSEDGARLAGTRGNFIKKALVGLTLASATLFPSWSEAQTKMIGVQGGGAFPLVMPDPGAPGRLLLASDVAGISSRKANDKQWMPASEGLNNSAVATIAFAPSNPQIVYAGTKGGLHRSTNGGGKWEALDNLGKKISFARPANYRSIAIDSKNPDKVYIGTKNGDVYRTTDGGKTWTQVGQAWTKVVNKKATGVAISVVYLAEDGTLLISSAEGLRRLQGNEWKDVKTQTKKIYDIVGVEDKGKDTIYITDGKKIASAVLGSGEITFKYSPDVIQKGEMYRLSVVRNKKGKIKIFGGWRDEWNGGVVINDEGTWKDASGILQYNPILNPTRDWKRTGFGWVLSVTIDPHNPNTLYVTDFWSTWRSTDNGKTWQEFIEGAGATVGTHLTTDDKGNLYATAMDIGLVRISLDGKKKSLIPWSAKDTTTHGHVWRVFSRGDLLIATHTSWEGGINHVYVSADAGMTFKAAKGLPARGLHNDTMWGTGYARSFAADSFDKKKFYLGIDGKAEEGAGLYVSGDGAETWKRSEGQPASLKIYNGLVTDPSKQGVLYWSATGDKGGVYRSADGGKTWEHVLKNVPYIFDLGIAKDGTVYAGGDQGGPVLYSSADGKAWKLLKQFNGKSGIAGAITIDPNDPMRIAVSTHLFDDWSGGKIYVSQDGGSNWIDISSGLPNTSGASAMTFSKDGKTLYVSLYAGSVYSINVEQAVKSDPIDIKNAPHDLKAEILKEGEIHLRWKKPTELAVDYYDVYLVQKGQKDKWLQSFKNPSDSPTINLKPPMIPALTPGSEHTFSVQAVRQSPAFTSPRTPVTIKIPDGARMANDTGARMADESDDV